MNNSVWISVKITEKLFEIIEDIYSDDSNFISVNSKNINDDGMFDGILNKLPDIYDYENTIN